MMGGEGLPSDVDADLLEETKGFLDPDEGRALYELALDGARLGPCLEVGSYCGKSALFLGPACRSVGTVLFSIDHHRGSEEQQPGQEYFDPDLLDPHTDGIDTLPRFRQTLARAGLEETVVPLVCRSTVAARGWATPLGLVFVDGGHGYETVWTDYTAWAGHVIPGGYLLFHDIFEDPAQGGQAPFQIYGLARKSGLFLELPRVKSLGVLQRNPL